MLDPYTVLDFTDTRGELGPMLLGDLGADVIRVELPSGSTARSEGPWLAAGPMDRRSLTFRAFNRNKRSIVLDPASLEARAQLNELIRRCDFLFESWPASSLAEYGIDYAQARVLNPRIVFVRVSAFGDEAPYAGVLANDLVIAAMGGPVALQGVIERAPVRLSVPQVWRHAGAEAAVGAMAAHALMLRTGEGQYVDLSAQAAMTWTMLNAMDAWAIQGAEFVRGGGFNTGTSQFDLVVPCADGYLVALPTSRTILGCLARMLEDGVADESLYDLDWQDYDLKIRAPETREFNIHSGSDLCKRFFAKYTKNELYHFGLEHDITLAPVNSLAELLALRHLEVRDYWDELELPDGPSVRTPGLWAKANARVLTVRREAPALGEHDAEIRAELHRPPRLKALPSPTGAGQLPFEGITVADFSWVGVGPISAKFLADHGARVIRIESETRPDVLRGAVPFKDRVPGIDRSQFFGDFNTSKESITLDLKHPEAIEIAKQIVERSDVLIESFAPGVIGRMGLGYDAVSAINPGIIMLSTCLMGQSGPAAQMAGYGYHAGAIAGFYEITGWPDRAPSGPWVAYTDTVAPRFIAVLLAAALDHRRRTGEGRCFDVAQIEAALHFLAPELLDLQANGVAATRIGNRSTVAAPHGCYRCAGDDAWCAIAVDEDAQWGALCRVMGRADLLENPELMTHIGRLAAHAAIDAAIEAWSRELPADEAMRALQAGGVPAGVVQRSRELLADRQYAERGFYRWLDHPVMGRVPYAGHAYRIQGYDNGPRFAAPTLGQHTFEVLSGLLGMGDEAIANLYASGAVA